jgi:hypothetical protein
MPTDETGVEEKTFLGRRLGILSLSTRSLRNVGTKEPPSENKRLLASQSVLLDGADFLPGIFKSGLI